MKQPKREVNHIGLLAAMFQRSQHDLELTPEWRRRVMDTINNSMAPNPVQIWAEEKKRAYARLSFRFAGAAGLAAAALCLYAMLYGPDLEARAARLLMDYPDLSRYLGEVLWT